MGDSSSSSQSRSNINSPTSVGDNPHLPPPTLIHNINVGESSSPPNSPTRGLSSSHSIPTSSRNININIPIIPTTTTTTTTTITTTTINIPPPPPPPPPISSIPIAPTQGQHGGPGESGRRKRGRPSTRGSSSGTSGGGDKRGKGELDAPKNIDPTCSLCGKEFASWKAYFGHLRSHPDRQWRGAFPPPTTLGPAVESLAPTLLKIAEETLASRNINVRVSNPQEGLGTSSRASPTAAGTSVTPSKFSFDLNELPLPEEEDKDEDGGNGQEKKKDDKGKRKVT